MVVFGAFVPHSPLLVPSIGLEPSEAIDTLRASLQEVSERLFENEVETVVLLSTHATQFPNAFSIQVHDPYRVDLTRFGDLTPSRGYRAHLGIIDAIQRQARKEGIPLSLNTDEALDYGAGVPLTLLVEPFTKMNVVAITWSGLSSKDHLAFGRLLKDVLQGRSERIAVIASGDLSHALSHESPEGFHDEGPLFDKTVCSALTHASLSQLLSLEGEVATRAAQCAFPALLLLLSLTERIPFKTRVLAYETPFGVGMAVATFTL